MSRKRLIAVALAGAIVLGVPAANAGVSVRSVGTADYPVMRVTVLTSEPSSQAPTLRENGLPVRVNRTENLGAEKSVVLAIDRSQSMRGAPLANAIAAARSFVASKPAEDRVAVGSFATQPKLLTDFTTERGDAVGALQSIQVDPVQGTTLYDMIVKSANLLADEPLEARVMIVVTDGNETRSSASLNDAISAARKAGASIYVVAIESPKFNPAPLHKLAEETGGVYHGTSSSDTLSAQYAAIAAELKRTWMLDYATAVRPGETASVVATWKGQESVAKPITLPSSLGPGSAGEPSHLLPDAFYKTVLGTQVMAIISFFIVLIAASLALTTVKGARLKKRLQPHLAPEPGKKRLKQDRERLAAAAGLFNATESAFERFKLWKRLDRLVERSDLPVRTVEVFYVMCGLSLVAGLIGTMVSPSMLITLGAFAAGAAIPVGFVWFKASRRLKAFENQLPDVLITLAAALKAGHSFKAGLQTIVDEGNPPASKEFHRVLAEARLGKPLESALYDMSERLGSKNFDFVITAVKIQQQVGGSLAGLVDMVADTVRQRQQFIRKVKGLTAMGRAGAYVLVGLPFFIAAAITIINPTYMTPLYHTSTGHMLIYTGLGMMAFGSLILKKIVSFKG